MCSEPGDTLPSTSFVHSAKLEMTIVLEHPCRTLVQGLMNISGVEATGSGRSRAEDSEALAQVAGYGARQGSRSLHLGQAKPKRHL